MKKKKIDQEKGDVLGFLLFCFQIVVVSFVFLFK